MWHKFTAFHEQILREIRGFGKCGKSFSMKIIWKDQEF